MQALKHYECAVRGTEGDARSCQATQGLTARKIGRA
jgi:hypothetical protein